jgi:branched-chain amino acid transport system substrate-binding protein
LCRREPARPDLDRPETRDIVQNVYLRKAEKPEGELHDVKFATFEAVRDPGKLDTK